MAAKPDLATPMMRQYRRLKQEHPDCILLFRCGDFYETYLDDAIEAGRLLSIVVTRKAAGVDGDVPMAGVPFHALETYLARLVKAGRSVAIAEQTEDPKYAKGLVRREIARVVTPGTALEPGILDDRANNFLAAIVEESAAARPESPLAPGGDLFGAADRPDESDGSDRSDGSDSSGSPAGAPRRFGIAIVDLSTGAFSVTEVEGARAREEVLSELVRLEPAEILMPDGAEAGGLFPSGADLRTHVTRRPEDRFHQGGARRLLLRQFGVQSLEGFGADHLTIGLGAAGAILDYLHETQKGALPHIAELRVYRRDDRLILDAVTQRSLELARNLHGGGREATLLSVLDRTHTAMGGRLLRAWVLAPLGRKDEIESRLGAVENFFASMALRGQTGEILRGLPDLERVVSRVACDRASPRDVAAIRASLDRLPRLARALESADAPRLREIAGALQPMPELAARLHAALVDEPPPTAREGGVIRPGWDARLDELKAVASDTKGWIAAFRAREALRLNLPNLKIGFNKVFGYYIELSKAQIRQVAALPDDYQRRQTIANGERFITTELKEKEEIILHAEEKINALEAELFEALRAEVAEQARELLAQARLLAELDALLSLAEAALAGGYTRPAINDDGRLFIREGRHPVLEAVQAELPFVPNDALLTPDETQIMLITGPNMAGKSTYIRQVALIVLMAHVGSFVPAREADVCLFDRIFTRVGAMDHLARGQSTFLVEMIETANILNNATDRSLVILDEIGRGTSTYDGMSIAWAVLEYLHNTPDRRPKTLFATHYHELTDLAGRLPRLRNFNVAVLEEKDEIVFLYRIVSGPADRSYGIHAAKLAGVPTRAIRRARQILRSLEDGQSLAVDSEKEEAQEGADSTGPKARRAKGRLSFLDDFDARRLPAAQLTLFDAPHPVIERLKAVRTDRMTPLEALNLLHELKELLEKRG